jgi:4-amino-4-deoxy-L-arabinose transferase-like glycosyltransferase
MSSTSTPRLLLWGILAIALAVRLWGITFGLPHVRTRPDELFIIGAAIGMHGGDSNPHFFHYPGLYLYFVAGLYAVFYGIGRLTGQFGSSEAFVASFREAWTPYFLIPRVTAAVMGAATVPVVYGIGALLMTRAAGVVAALFLSLAFLHVRDSHYATTDVPMTFFVMCAVLAAVRVHKDRRASDAWLSGILAGCAASIKYNAVFVVLVLASVEALHAWRRRREWRRLLGETHIFRMAASCVFIFAVTNPYLFLDHTTAWQELSGLAMQNEAGMTPPELLGRGWTYHLPNSLRHGLGLPLLVAGLGGFAWMAARQPATALILGIFPVAYYVVVGMGHNVFVRYVIPVVPFLCLFAAYTVTEAARLLARGALAGREALAAGGLAVAIVAPTAWSTVQFDYLLSQDDNRNVAARWVEENVPLGSSIYTAGNLYGHLQLEVRGRPQKYRYLDFDWRAERFTESRTPVEDRPDWIILQRSGILYSHVSPSIERLVQEEYALAATLRAADLSEKNFYDIQDGFYAPFGSFKGVKRFGPNYEIYRRRSPH